MMEEQFTAEKNYQATMLCFRNMLAKGEITEAEYEEIDSIMLKRYRPLLGKLFSDKSLTSEPKRATYNDENG